MRTFSTRNFKKKNKITTILALLLVLVVGYAMLSTQLKVDGTVNISKMDWDVHFENVEITSGSVSATTAPTSNNVDTTEMEYAVNLSKPGDYYEFTADIVNKGTMSAKITELDNKLYDSNDTAITAPNYLKTSITYLNNSDRYESFEYFTDYNTIIEPNASLKIKIRVEFDKWVNVSDLPSDGAKDFSFKLKVDYEQADTIYAKSTCPGKYCVYASPYPVGLSPYSPKYPTREILTDYETDYKALNKNVFGGFVIDDSNRIIKTYICGIHDDKKVYCAGSSEKLEDIATRMNSSSLWDDECQINYSTYEEEEYVSGVHCIGETTKLDLYEDGGSVYDSATNEYCTMYNGVVICGSN